MTAQARRSHSGAGHLGGWFLVRCQEPPVVSYRPGHPAPAWPEVSARRWWLERLGGGDTGTQPPAQPGFGRCGPGLRSAPDRTWVSFGTEEGPEPSRKLNPEREETPGCSTPSLRRTRKLISCLNQFVLSSGPSVSLVTFRPAKRRRIACSYRAANGASATYWAITCSPNQTRTRRRCCRAVISAMLTASHPVTLSPCNQLDLLVVMAVMVHEPNVTALGPEEDLCRTSTGPLADIWRTAPCRGARVETTSVLT